MVDEEIVEVKLGQMISVEGYVFKLVSFERHINKPSKVVFKSPEELMVMGQDI